MGKFWMGGLPLCHKAEAEGGRCLHRGALKAKIDFSTVGGHLEQMMHVKG